MADDSKKTLAFKISIEGVSQEGIELQKLEKNLQNLKKERKELLDLSKKEGIMSTDTAAKLAAYDAEIKRVTESKKNLQKVVGTASDSLVRMRAELAAMKKQAAEGSQELNTKMTPAIKALSDKIMGLEAAQGAHQRNVGNYIEAFRQAPGPLGVATNALYGFGTAAKALLLNPIVLAITALIAAGTLLFKVFTDTATGAAVMKDAMAGLKAQLNVLRDQTVSLFDSIKKLFSGDMKGALDSYNESMDITGQKMRDAAVAAMELAQAQRALNKEMAFEISANAERNNQIQELLFLSKDKSLADQERVDMLQKALDLGKEEANQQVGFAEEQFRIDSENAALKAKNSGVTAEALRSWIMLDKDAQLQTLKHSEALQKLYDRLGGSKAVAELEESYAKVVNAETEFFAHNKRAIGQMSSLTEELQSDWLKGWEDRYKKAEDLLKVREEREKERKKQKAADLKAEAELAKHNLDAEDKMRKIYQAEWKKMVEEEKNQSEFNSNLKKLLGIKESDLGLQQNKALADGARKVTEAGNKADAKIRKQHEDTILELKKAGLQGAQMGADAAFQAKKSRLQAEMEAELSNQNLTEKQRTDIRKKYAKEQQKIDIQQALINGALAIGNALATSKPFFPMAIIGAGLAAVTAGIQVAAIKAAKYAAGGRIYGGAQISQDQSKDNTIILAKQGEVVLNENQQRRLGGSRTFKRIGVPGFEAGGVIGMPYPEAAGSEMERMMRDMAAIINDKKVILEVQKLNAAQRETEIINQTNLI